MRPHLFLLNILVALSLALGASGAPRASAHGLTLVICGADGPYTITLEDKEKPRADCCDCCLAVSFAALPVPGPDLPRRAESFADNLAPGASQGAADRPTTSHPARGPPVSA